YSVTGLTQTALKRRIRRRAISHQPLQAYKLNFSASLSGIKKGGTWAPPFGNLSTCALMLNIELAKLDLVQYKIA
ncbi:hypothetical protein RFZ44_07810, partial [Acinetobacter sp. 163]|nr:hypothetical protein [Acinetobacter sp. 163]